MTWDDATSQTVKSGEPFKVYGNALTLNVGDESAELQLPGEAEPVAVALSPVVEGNWQRLEGRLAHPVEACKGAVLAVKTHGYDPDSGLKVVKSRPLTVLADAPTPVEAPTITSAGTRGDGDGFVNITGTLDVTGENLDEATEIQLLRDSGEPWQTVQATYADGKLTAELDFQSKPCENGAVRVTTPGGSATYEVVYGDH